jgi:hypothetical protein
MKAKGSALGMTALSLTTPVTAQLINLDNGKCWESSFSTAKTSSATVFKAQLP